MSIFSFTLHALYVEINSVSVFLFTFHALYVEINLGKAFLLAPDKLRQRQTRGCDLMSCGTYPHCYYMRFPEKNQILI